MLLARILNIYIYQTILLIQIFRYSDSTSRRGYYNAYTCDTHYRSPYNFRSYLYSKLLKNVIRFLT